MKEEIIQTLSFITGEKIDDNTNLLLLANKNKIGVGDLLDSLCEKMGVKIKNNSFPLTVGEIVLI